MGKHPQKLAGKPVLPLNPGAWQPIGGARSAGKGLNLCPQPLLQQPWSMGKLCRRRRMLQVVWEAGQAPCCPSLEAAKWVSGPGMLQ